MPISIQIKEDGRQRYNLTLCGTMVGQPELDLKTEYGNQTARIILKIGCDLKTQEQLRFVFGERGDVRRSLSLAELERDALARKEGY